MPNKCTQCGKFHELDAHYLIDGCDECGSKFFFFVRQGNVQVSVPEAGVDLTQEIQSSIPQDVGVQEVLRVDFGLESIRMVKPGRYFLDLDNLFKQKPIVMNVSPGKYSLDISVLSGPRKK